MVGRAADGASGIAHDLIDGVPAEVKEPDGYDECDEGAVEKLSYPFPERPSHRPE